MNFNIMQVTHKIEIEFEDAPLMENVADPEELAGDPECDRVDLQPTGALISVHSNEEGRSTTVVLFGDAHDHTENDHYRTTFVYAEDQTPEWLKPIVSELTKEYGA